jgi:hypothetical protein
MISSAEKQNEKPPVLVLLSLDPRAKILTSAHQEIFNRPPLHLSVTQVLISPHLHVHLHLSLYSEMMLL